MALLYYGGRSTPILFEDRLLAHLKVVIATKLRRHETFTLSWVHSDGEPRGRTTIWLHPSIPLRFVFDAPDPELLNDEWLRTLAIAASSTGGIQVSAERPPA